MVLLHCLWFKYMLNEINYMCMSLASKIQHGIKAEFLKRPLHKAIEEASHPPLAETAKTAPLILLVFALYTGMLRLIFA
jgi:hypothetical protein